MWFAGANWNWTMSPTAAVTESGEYARVPFAFPTLTTWTVVPAASWLLVLSLILGDEEHTKGAADAQGRECECCELHIGGDEKRSWSLKNE